MKQHIHLLAAGALLTLFSACEMKDELLGKDGNISTPTGELELSLPSPVTRAATRADVSTDNFQVDIASTDGHAENNRHYATFAEMRLHDGDSFGTVRLPIGAYEVTAQSPGTVASIMDTPYYRGSSALTIEEGITAQANVECTRLNTEVTLNFDATYLNTFPTWTITLENGANGEGLTYTLRHDELGAQETSRTFFWNLSESQTSDITLTISAKNQDEQSIIHKQHFYKPDHSNFSGNDRLTVNLMLEDEKPNADGTFDFDITVDLTFEDKNESVEIPVDDVTPPVTDPDDPEDPDTPENPGGDEEAISMQMPSNGHISYSLSEGDQPETADVLINVPKGLKSMNVKITAGNEDFGKTISDLSASGLDFVTNGVEMVGNEIIGGVLSAFLGGGDVSAPALGDTSYTFPVGAFFNLMNGFGATTPEAHVFKIAVEDQEGNHIEDELQVTINQ